MSPRLSLLSLSLLCAATASALDLGNTVFIGDSITQGGQGFASYRYEMWKTLVDNGATFNFVGSQTRAYANNAGTIPTYRGQTFSNVHDGHWGWRASWISGAVPLLDGRYDTNNLGNGVLSTWLGLSPTYRTAGTDGVTNLQTRTYTGTTYTPDTAFILIGVNDIGSSGGAYRTAAQVAADIHTMVTQLQQKNANVRVYVNSILPSSNSTAEQAQKIADTNAALAANAASWSTGGSTVSYVNLREGFTASGNGLNATQTDGTHPNYLGQRIMAKNLAAAMGVGVRDNTLGLAGRSTAVLGATSGFRNDMNALPGTSASGNALFRAGTTPGAWTAPTAGELTFNASATTSWLQSNWGLTAGQAYTMEFNVQVTAGGSNGFVIWADDGAGGAAAGFLRIYENRTMWGYNTSNSLTVNSGYFVLDTNLNSDGFHTFRLVSDGSTYAVWRDGALIADGLSGSSAAGDNNRLIVGNFTSNTTSAKLDNMHLDTAGAYAFTAVPEPATYGLLGAAGVVVAAFARRRRKVARAA